MRRPLKFLLAAAAAVVAGAVILSAAAWIVSRRQPVVVPELTAKLLPESGAGLGGDVTAAVDIPLPLCCGVENAAVTAPPGTVGAGSPLVTWHKLRFSTRNWQVKATLRPVRPGKIAEGKLVFEVRRGGDAPRVFTAKIPAFDVRETEGAGKLELASKVDVRKGFPRWTLWFLLLIPAALLLYFYLTRPRKPRELTEWERAVRELADLRRKIDSGQLPPEQAFIGLVELMRRYLERRFGLPVTRRTAQEFIEIMDRCGDSLPPDSRPFFREFLEEADLVKFARAVPEKTLVERTAAGAERFIGHTRPESEVKDV